MTRVARVADRSTCYPGNLTRYPGNLTRYPGNVLNHGTWEDRWRHLPGAGVGKSGQS